MIEQLDVPVFELFWKLRVRAEIIQFVQYLIAVAHEPCSLLSVSGTLFVLGHLPKGTLI